MNKKTLLCVIDSLGRGGAEMLLVGLLPELNNRFRVILVTLSGEIAFDESQIISSKKYSLGFKGKHSLLPAIIKLKKIIRQTRPDLVHAHLLHSSIVARAACPAHIPLVYSLHTIMSKDAFDGSRLNAWLEKRTLKKGQAVIAVSEAVLDDYRKLIALPGPAYVLKNYVSNAFLLQQDLRQVHQNKAKLQLVAVGNIKPVKNYEYLLKAFEQLKSLPVSLDIFGHGEAGAVKVLQDEIDSKKLNIVLKGSTGNIATLLPAYDLFVMSSSYEGFGIAPIEAMATGLPLLLSDIPVFKEITFGNALFFDLSDPKSFVTLLQRILSGEVDVQALSNSGVIVAREHYSKSLYVTSLFSIYDEVMEMARIK